MLAIQSRTNVTTLFFLSAGIDAIVPAGALSGRLEDRVGPGAAGRLALAIYFDPAFLNRWQMFEPEPGCRAGRVQATPTRLIDTPIPVCLASAASSRCRIGDPAGIASSSPGLRGTSYSGLEDQAS